ncbi:MULTISPECIES: RDD family protein [Kitasatospora]|uniref:RDD domain-containing protein n=1 Tax=Kitasatospora setae (strain ATCC 33774 / DSM 43861 / JCM 3304 / KCC A-0304 / NBRC 14216 / KM-6054) TaxID=452652 RepID=E4NC09_KITSK|nr:RDD family protein [Kitasatospora setae]BAJ28740.1 hypothetical protein KSE_29280 [Kitasatospora setae KM-6054]
MSELVTGEAVVLGLRTARLPSRALARLLDWLVYTVGYTILLIALLAGFSDLEPAAVMAFAITLLVFFTVLLPTLIETLSHGRSLGKTALGLRVVRADGGPIRFRHALVRGLVGIIDFGVFAMPAVVASLCSVHGNRLGDVFAGTLVIRERLPQSARDQGTVPPVPPQVMHALGAELVALDLSAVPDGLWLSARQVLSRMGELDQPVAAALGDRLAAEMVRRTGWQVPVGLPSLVYLGAVLMERQRREWERASAAQLQAYQAYQAAHAAQPGRPAPVPPQPGPPVRELGYPQAAQAAPVPSAPPAPPAPPAEQAAQAALPSPAGFARPVDVSKAPAAPPAAAPESGGGFAPPA